MRKAEAERRERLRRSIENLHPGRVLAGQYLVQEKAGTGAEGVVYLVRDQFIRAERALKFYFDPDAIRYLTRVGNKMSHLHHENIVRHFGVGHVKLGREQVLFLVTEAYNGPLLAEYQDRFPGRRLGLFEALRFFSDIVRGLAYAHSLGFVHEDLHRENVVLHRDPRRKTRKYMARLNDFFPTGRTRDVTRRQADVREAGFLLYEMLTGKLDYSAARLQKLPDECAELIRRCVHRDRRRRYSDARKIQQALKEMQWA